MPNYGNETVKDKKGVNQYLERLEKRKFWEKRSKTAQNRRKRAKSNKNFIQLQKLVLDHI